ncbi:WD-40 repeat protein [Reticulomyxa filosa]|uniref:WD-40 repeat protein n=1 Tax=Reticulomyxa filosa TaxID=46433 RepID=X6MNW8_RETFI|nr:WD-40 repeat protein [Reticulomyxa filosa]|eukprot:ETO15544.1 WD-40 repeat protein [Reticulomyxa filosa]
MGNPVSKKESSTQQQLINLSTEEVIIKYWIRVLNIKLGWIQNFDKMIVKYVKFIYFLFYSILNLFANNFFNFEIFCSSSKSSNIFTGHTDWVNSIDFFTFDNDQFICSGSYDNTARVWNAETKQQIQVFSGYSDWVYCARFSPYHYHNNRRNVICFSLHDNTIYFCDIKHNQQLQVFNEHINWINCIEFSSFSGGRYLCSGSADDSIRLWDVKTSKSLHIFNGHTDTVKCVDISPLQSNNNNKNNNIGVISGNGYTICSGSSDKTIRIWDIETTKQLILFKGHKDRVMSVKYGSNELGNIGCANTILSGSNDKSVCLWDIRSGKQIQMFNGHTHSVQSVEYSPFAVKCLGKVSGNSNVICSGSWDRTIRFWDIRSNKNELYTINGDGGIMCLKFLQLRKDKKSNNDSVCDINLCYGSTRYSIHIC